MPTYKTPGVYVEEISSLPPSIVAVETAIPCFIGYTDLHNAHAPLVNPSDANTPTYPVRISSMAEYERIFGGPHVEISVAIDPDSPADDWVLGTVTVTSTCNKHLMHPMLQMYFMNGGGPCYVVSVRSHHIDSGSADQVTATLLGLGIDSANLVDEPTLLVFPDLTNISTGTYYTVSSAALAQCATRKDRFCILDFPVSSMSTSAISTFRTSIGVVNLEYAAVYGPRLNSSIAFSYKPKHITLSIAVGAAGNTWLLDPRLVRLDEVLALIENPPSGSVDAPIFQTQLSENVTPQAIYAAINTALASLAGLDSDGNYILPPSGAIAGVYAAVDRGRGVWNAPANISLAGVNSVSERFTPALLEDLNVPADGFGKSINPIRTVAGRGHLVMGARTLLANSLEWRYINVRRTFIFIEESIAKSMSSVVFEPNTFETWTRVKNMIENFLRDIWRQGGLFGAKPEQAFFVRVGLGATMTPEDILAGRLIVDVGIAAQRPAEFIVLRFSHLLQQS